MDVDAVIAEVSAAVGLAEGESGVRDILRVIARSEPVAAREVGRQAELPVPIVTAVCNELRKRGVVDRARPVQLTAEARDLLGGGHQQVNARCPCCGGRGIVIPAEIAQLAGALEAAAAAAPEAKAELDQTHCTVPTKIHRVLMMHESGALVEPADPAARRRRPGQRGDRPVRRNDRASRAGGKHPAARRRGHRP